MKVVVKIEDGDPFEDAVALKASIEAHMPAQFDPGPVQMWVEYEE